MRDWLGGDEGLRIEATSALGFRFLFVSRGSLGIVLRFKHRYGLWRDVGSEAHSVV